MILKILATPLTKKQQVNPTRVGKTKAKAVHLVLLVSLCMVKRVVPHGKCISENSIVHKAVNVLQPLFVKRVQSVAGDETSVKLLAHKYAITIIGITISLAGNPNINAIKITPSSPIILAKGSKKDVQYFKRLISLTFIFERHQINKPAGAATNIALYNTNRVLSKIDRIINFPI